MGFTRTLGTNLKSNRTLLLMCAPAILFFLVFSYIPMPGLIIAFQQFNYGKGIFGSKLIGSRTSDTSPSPAICRA